MSFNDPTLISWLSSGDSGISSLTIVSVLADIPFAVLAQRCRPGVPYDPDDLGRCMRLLDVKPEWRSRMSEVARRYPEWAGLVARWDDLSSLFWEEAPSGRALKTFALMEEIRGAA